MAVHTTEVAPQNDAEERFQTLTDRVDQLAQQATEVAPPQNDAEERFKTLTDRVDQLAQQVASIQTTLSAPADLAVETIDLGEGIDRNVLSYRQIVDTVINDPALLESVVLNIYDKTERHEMAWYEKAGMRRDANAETNDM